MLIRVIIKCGISDLSFPCCTWHVSNTVTATLWWESVGKKNMMVVTDSSQWSLVWDKQGRHYGCCLNNPIKTLEWYSNLWYINCLTNLIDFAFLDLVYWRLLICCLYNWSRYRYYAHKIMNFNNDVSNQS